MSDVKILAIESSCDETAASVVVNGRDVRSNVISSQIDIHTLYGGVVPEIASRKHIERINQVVQEALDQAQMTLDDIGHISANYIENQDLEPPFGCLVVSGGHTHLVLVKDYGEYEILGKTADDAAGEAFDKVARAIGLGYPGGPKIDKAAREGDPLAIEFPHGKVRGSEYDFSFSGLKSAVLNYLNEKHMKGEEISVNDVAASFQKSVVDVLVEHSMHAVNEFGFKKFAIAGGVASNSALRTAMEEACRRRHVQFYRPSPILCTDNAAMIGAAAYYDYLKGIRSDWSLNAVPNLKLGER